MRTMPGPRRLASAAASAKSARCSSRRRSAAGWSLISARYWAPASDGDTCFTPDQHPLDLELVVEDDQVGGGADCDPPDLCVDHAGGDGGCSVERGLER